MAAPTLISTTPSTDFTNLSATNKDTPSVSWNAADLIAVWGFTGDNGFTLTAPVATGLTLANVLTTNVASRGKMYLWTATAAGTSSSTFTGTISSGGGGGYVVKVWRGASGFGTISSVGSGTSGAPTVAYTIAALDSVVDGGWVQWNANAGARTYLTTNLGIATENQYFSNAGYGTSATWNNAATTATGSQSIGLSAPTPMDAWLIAGMEILGTTTGIPAFAAQLETVGNRKMAPGLKGPGTDRWGG